MSITTIAASGNSNITINSSRSVLYISTNGAGSATLKAISGCGNFTTVEFSGQRTFSFPALGVVNIAMSSGGSCNYEVNLGAGVGEISNAQLLQGADLSAALIDKNGYYFSSNGAIDIRSYGAKCDGDALYDVTTTATATCTVTSITASFTNDDVGKNAAILAYLDTMTVKYGVITSVNSPTSAVVTLNSAIGALTNATMVYGTDDSAAINLACAAAKLGNGAVFVPGGISCVKASSIIIPVGVTLFGITNFATGGRAKDFKYSGSSIVSVGYNAQATIIAGDSSGADPKGSQIYGLNIDAFGLAYNAYTGGSTSRTSRIDHCTLLRGVGETIVGSPTSRINNCSIFGQHQSIASVVTLYGDSTFSNNIVTGAGKGQYSIKLSNADDINISNNHMWKDGSLASMLGGQIFISLNTGFLTSGSVTILGNKLDTSFGPHIYIKASGNSKGRGININSNHAFQNDSVPNATYPFMQVEIQAGSELRGLNVHGNGCHASWNDPTKGTLTAFLDNSASVGTITGSSITGNIADNCAAGYISLTPTYTAGNMFIAGTGTTVTLF